MHVTVWNEYIHEKQYKAIKDIYPRGIHGCLVDFLRKAGLEVEVATLEMTEHGLSESVLNRTDVLIWWGHCAHDAVSDLVVEKVKIRVLQGMGFIALHSAHHSKIMKVLLGTTLNLRWRDDDRERLWCIAPSHPIAEGIPEYIELEHEEMYGEQFDIPSPDEVIFLGWFAGGEVFRSGCTFTRGRGKIFYFQPGHEAYPIYYKEEIQRIIINAVHWAAPINQHKEVLQCIHAVLPLEEKNND